MSYPVYMVPAGDVLPVMFGSYDGGTGASITLTGLAVTDIEIYKDGSVTQRSSDAGYVLLDTDGIDFDALTGIHGFSIDTGDNTDASFYTVGAWFHVVVSAVTIDAQTVSFIACAFRLMAAEGVAGVPDVNVTHVSDTAQTAGDLKASLNIIDDFLDTEVAAILAAVGAVADAAADGDVTTSDTLMAYVKQIVNTLVTTAGIVTWPASAAPGNAVSMAEAIRQIYDEIIIINDFLDTEIAAILEDTGTTLDDFIDTEVAAIKAKTDSLTFTVANVVDSNMTNMAGATAGVTKLNSIMTGTITGAVNAGVPTTTVFIADGFTEATDDHFNGRLVTWTSGALLGQQTDVTDYTGATQTFTVTALTEAPADNDTFVLT